MLGTGGWRLLAGDRWLGTGGWRLWGQGLAVWWLGVTMLGHWQFSWLIGCMSREAWFSVQGLDRMVHGSLFRDW